MSSRGGNAREGGAAGSSSNSGPSQQGSKSKSKQTQQNQQNQNQNQNGQNQGQQSSASGTGSVRKRKNHRAGKKRRRKSFAVTATVPEEEHDHDDVQADPLKDAAQAVSRDELYNMRGRNHSNTSIDSETLLDHRDQQPFLRIRRSSMATPSLAQGNKFPFAQSPTRTRADDEDAALWDERAPLLSQSGQQQQRQQQQKQSRGNEEASSSARAAAFGGYGTSENRRNQSPSRRSSRSSGRNNKFLNPFSASSESYNINYPPSVPGSPPRRSLELDGDMNFGDEMLRDEFQQDRGSLSQSPSMIRRANTTANIMSSSGGNNGLDRGERSTSDNLFLQPSPISRRHPSLLDAEDDVCFPQGNLSEIAEDDNDHHDGGSTGRLRASRRRRVKWPDLAILDDWSRFEKEGRSEQERRAKKITEPQLVNGRLRPVHKGWHRAEEDAPYRFTYFNEEFQSTIHSQTISELVQPDSSFRELFIPDPPILSESEDDAYGSDAADDDGYLGDEPIAGLHRDSFSTMNMNDSQILTRESSHIISGIAAAVATATVENSRPGTRTGYRSSGNGSPDKQPGTSAAPSPMNATAAALGRSPQLTSSDNKLAAAMKSPPLVLSPPKSAFDSPATVPTTPLKLADKDKQKATTGPTAAPAAAVASLASAAAAAAAAAAATAATTSGNTTVPGTTTSSTPTPTPLSKPATKPVRYGERPVWWLDVLSPTEAEMKTLSKAFGIHPLTAEDIIMQEAREKVELFQHYYFVSYRSFDQDPNSETFLEPVNMYVVVFREGVLSFHFSMTPHPANVRRRIRQLRDYMILSSDWISYAIIDDITDVFVPLIQNIEEEVDDIDDAILEMHSSSATKAGMPGMTSSGGAGGHAGLELPTSARRERFEKLGGGNNNSNNNDSSSNAAAMTAEADTNMLRRVGDCRKRVMSLYRLLGNKADVIKGFAKRCNEHWEVAPRSEIGLYLGDIQDHIVTMTSNLSHYEKILSRSHANYLAQINIRMNERQEQTADVLGKLTVLGTIVLPMNIITGLWGMNVWVPGQDYEGNLWWFWLITAGLFLFGATCYMTAKRVYKIV